MGAHSTLVISRGAARQIVAMRLLRPMGDAEMEAIVDDVLDCALYNVRISDFDSCHAEDEEALSIARRECGL